MAGREEDTGVPGVPPALRRALDVGGPVLAELFVITDTDESIVLSGPCGAAAWLIEVPEGEDPMATARAVVERVLGPPLLLHSTSWRRDRSGVVLSFLVVMDAAALAGMDAAPIVRAELARGAASAAPAAIAGAQVLEHALRHLAWLVKDDDVVGSKLDTRWHARLSDYVPEPFRHLDTRRSDA